MRHSKRDSRLLSRVSTTDILCAPDDYIIMRVNYTSPECFDRLPGNCTNSGLPSSSWHLVATSGLKLLPEGSAIGTCGHRKLEKERKKKKTCLVSRGNGGEPTEKGGGMNWGLGSRNEGAVVQIQSDGVAGSWRARRSVSLPCAPGRRRAPTQCTQVFHPAFSNAGGPAEHGWWGGSHNHWPVWGAVRTGALK